MTWINPNILLSKKSKYKRKCLSWFNVLFKLIFIAIALQCPVGFCCIATWISYTETHTPSFFCISFPFRPSEITESSSLYYTVGSQVTYLYIVVYTCHQCASKTMCMTICEEKHPRGYSHIVKSGLGGFSFYTLLYYKIFLQEYILHITQLKCLKIHF